MDPQWQDFSLGDFNFDNNQSPNSIFPAVLETSVDRTHQSINETTRDRSLEAMFSSSNIDELPAWGADTQTLFPSEPQDSLFSVPLHFDQQAQTLGQLSLDTQGFSNQNIYDKTNPSDYPLLGLDLSPYCQPYRSNNAEQLQNQMIFPTRSQASSDKSLNTARYTTPSTDIWGSRETSLEHEATPASSIDMRKVSSNRTAKQRGDPSCDPSQCYEQEPKTPPPWGSMTWYGQHLFSYTPKGQWLRDRCFDANQLREYVDNCNKDTVLWIQQTPTQCNHRLDVEDRMCRWVECPVPNRTITAGWLRVAFDEFPHLTSNGSRDPLKCAGSMHLWCFEQVFDPVELHTSGRLRPENRQFPLEDKSAVTLEKLTDAGIIREAYQPWFNEKAQQFSQLGPMQGLRAHEESLSYRLNRYHVENQTAARQKARSKRNNNKSDDEKRTIDVHMGNLGLYVEITRKSRCTKKSRRLRETSVDGNDTEISSMNRSSCSSEDSQFRSFSKRFAPSRDSASRSFPSTVTDPTRRTSSHYNLRPRSACAKNNATPSATTATPKRSMTSHLLPGSVQHQASDTHEEEVLESQLHTTHKFKTNRFDPEYFSLSKPPEVNDPLVKVASSDATSSRFKATSAIQSQEAFQQGLNIMQNIGPQWKDMESGAGASQFPWTPDFGTSHQLMNQHVGHNSSSDQIETLSQPPPHAGSTQMPAQDQRQACHLTLGNEMPYNTTLAHQSAVVEGITQHQHQRNGWVGVNQGTSGDATLELELFGEPAPVEFPKSLSENEKYGIIQEEFDLNSFIDPALFHGQHEIDQDPTKVQTQVTIDPLGDSHEDATSFSGLDYTPLQQIADQAVNDELWADSGLSFTDDLTLGDFSFVDTADPVITGEVVASDMKKDFNNTHYDMDSIAFHDQIVQSGNGPSTNNKRKYCDDDEMAGQKKSRRTDTEDDPTWQFSMQYPTPK